MPPAKPRGISKQPKRASPRLALEGLDPSDPLYKERFAILKIRAIRDRNSKVIAVTESHTLLALFREMERGRCIKAPENRETRWSDQQMASAISTMWTESKMPTDFLIRECDSKEESKFSPGEKMWHIYDGGNRCAAISKFMKGDLAVPLVDGVLMTFTRLKEHHPEEAAYIENIKLHPTFLYRCSNAWACEMASKKNEGTIMSIGEKQSLLRRVNTPRARFLNKLLSENAFMTLGGDNAAGVRLLSRYIYHINTHGISSVNGISDVHSKDLQSFFRKPTEISHIDQQAVLDAFSQVEAYCEGGSGRPPSIEAAIKAKWSCSKATIGSYFYFAVIAMVKAHLTYGDEITEEAMLERVLKLRRVHVKKKRFNPLMLNDIILIDE